MITLISINKSSNPQSNLLDVWRFLSWFQQPAGHYPG